MSMGIQEGGAWGVGLCLYRRSRALVSGSWLVN